MVNNLLCLSEQNIDVDECGDVITELVGDFSRFSYFENYSIFPPKFTL